MIMQEEKGEGLRKIYTFHDLSVDRKMSENLSPIHDFNC